MTRATMSVQIKNLGKIGFERGKKERRNSWRPRERTGREAGHSLVQPGSPRVPEERILSGKLLFRQVNIFILRKFAFYAGESLPRKWGNKKLAALAIATKNKAMTVNSQMIKNHAREEDTHKFPILVAESSFSHLPRSRELARRVPLACSTDTLHINLN